MWAQLTELEVGKVYHFTNVNYSDKALAATYPNSVAGVAVDKDNKSQLWYIESKNVNGYLLRNLAFGTYLQGNGQSSRWTLASTTDSNNSWITLETAGGNNAFKGYTYGGYGYAHIDGSSNVVGWSTDASATQWTISKIGMSDDAIQAALGIFNNVATYQSHLDNLFSDKSCTTLKSGFSESNASFLALPTILQNMVRKVAGTTSWEEDYNNGKPAWGADYAKKYRVQWYEPYNEPECAAKALNLNAHTNLNNPTGIFAKNGDVLYVMVEGEIKPGAELYLSYYTGQNRLSGATDGYELKQGLNVIPVYYDESNFCVNYVVHTFDTSEGKKGNMAKARKLSDYAPIKIHIEGGYINGYWNKVGDALYGTGDTDENWNYIEARATQKDIVVLGKYMTLKFPLLSEHAQGNSAMSQIYNDMVSVSASIAEWDNIMLWERFLMGLSTKAELDDNNIVSPYSGKTVFAFTEEDYTDYYNVHGLAINVEDNKNPHAGWDYTGYPNYSLKSVNADVIENAGAHWTAGHEIGHQHQGPLNMRGLTEVTNNLFSNVVLWCFGKSTSRYNGTDGALTNVLQQFNAEGTDFFSNNIWAQTIMYYKLFLYYHVLGHDPQFYPRLFEMLRQNPMTIEGNQDGSECLMHFYKLCCDAAGADLTEFFRAHGFFEVMNSRFVGDYSSATYNLTQAQIDQAITEVKAKRYPVNLAVLFINDATGEEIQSHKGGVLELYGETRVCSEIGSYSNFNGDAANYTYGVAGNLVTMEGEGGVGFAILNEKGELIGFSDKKTFELSAEAATAIASGKASIVSIKGDNTPVVATNVMDSDNIGTKYELLGELLDNSKFILTRADATGTKVGFYRESALEGLQRAYDKAKEVYDAMTVAAYSSVYDVLFQEYVNIMSNEYARINITEGYAYRLTNKAYPDRSMAVNTENHQMFGLATAVSDAQLWYFEPGVTKNTYYLKNKYTGKYPGDVDSGKVLSADKGKGDGAYAYRLQEMQPGVFALVGETGLHCSASQNYNIVGWGADADASQWYITATALDETLEARTKLEETIAKTEALVNEMAEVKIKGSALDLTTCTITSNTPETGHETKYLVDGNPTTFFHTNWTGTAISENHNFIIDLGEGNSLEQFAFNYITLPNSAHNVDAPKAMVIEGSTDGTDYTSITTLNELPTTKGATYASTTLGTKGTAYRYLRFSVTDATGGKLGSYYYFGLAEFGLTNMQTELLSVKDGYSSSQTAILDACDGLYAANLVYNNETAKQEELQAAASALNAYYETLLNAYNAVKNAGLESKKTELQTLINKTNALIGECGSVVYTEETTPQLNVTAAPYMLSDNNVESEGRLELLYDGKQGKDFSYTSNWEHALTESPYLQVDLGTGNELEELIFTFTNRTEGNAPTPTEIVVSASADGNDFTEFATFISAESNWPPAANNQNIAATKWTSPVIEATSACRYWRFTVTKSQRSSGGETNNKGIYHFGISEFGIVIPAGYKVTVKPGMGAVDEALMLETYHEVAEAQSTITYATTEAQLDKAIAQLQAQHDVLLEAKNNQYAQDLQAKINETNELIVLCGSVENGVVVEVLETAGDATKQQILDAYNQVTTAQALINAGGATQEQYVEATNALEEKRAALETAKDGITRKNLRELTTQVSDLITLCATTPGDVSHDMLVALTTANQQALDLLQTDNLAAIAEKTTALQTQYTTVATAQQATGKSTLSGLITQMRKLISECTTGEGETLAYVGDVTETLLNSSIQAKNAAQAVIDANNTTTADFIAATETLQGYYSTLDAAKNSTAKADLREKISELADLIEKCRITVTNTATRTEECDLQTTESGNPFYLSTNAETAEGGIANLVDGAPETYFQTARSGAEEQCLLVDAGEGHSFKKFRFSYRTNKSPFPYTIKVYGRNDNSDFTELETINNLPIGADQSWTSSDISNETPYRYLRFNITKSVVALKVDDDELDTSGGGQLSNKFKSSTFSETPASEYCFVMSEFKITNIVDEEQETEILAGSVTEQQLNDATVANEEAETLADESAIQQDLIAKTEALQIIYDALYAAAFNVKLTPTSKEKDTLLKGIEDGQTVSTFSAPYATVIPAGVTAYYAKKASQGETLYLTAVESGKALPACQGVILIGNVGVTAGAFVPATTEPLADLSGNVLANTATGDVYAGDNDYALAKGDDGIGIYKVKKDVRIKAGKAYLHFDTPSQARSFVLSFSGAPTAIEDSLTDTADAERPVIYDLYGRRVNETIKGGIYIVNGKKVFIK